MIFVAHEHTDQWHTARETGIGASEAPAACGLSRYETELDLWARKTRRTTRGEPTGPMQLGTYCERAILDRAAESYVVRHSKPGLYRHRELECVLASPDAILMDGRVLEVKLTTDANEDIGEDGDNLPQEWLCQVHQQIAVLDAPGAVVCVAVVPQRVRDWLLDAMPIGAAAVVVEQAICRGTIPVVPFELERHSVLIDRIIERDLSLWDHVLSDTPPVINWEHKQACDSVRRAFAEARTDKIIDLDSSQSRLWTVYREASANEREAKSLKESVGAQLYAIIRDAAGARTANGDTLKKICVGETRVEAHVRKPYSYLRQVKG